MSCAGPRVTLMLLAAYTSSVYALLLPKAPLKPSLHTMQSARLTDHAANAFLMAPLALAPVRAPIGNVPSGLQKLLTAIVCSRTQLPVFADDGPGFSQASYYTTLVLYVVSFPGVYSLVKRSVKSKVVRKTYEVPGPAAVTGRPTREVAGDIVAFFQANNYKITDVCCQPVTKCWQP